MPMRPTGSCVAFSTTVNVNARPARQASRFLRLTSISSCRSTGGFQSIPSVNPGKRETDHTNGTSSSETMRNVQRGVFNVMLKGITSVYSKLARWRSIQINKKLNQSGSAADIRESGCDSFQPLQHYRFGLYADDAVQFSASFKQQQGRNALDTKRAAVAGLSSPCSFATPTRPHIS